MKAKRQTTLTNLKKAQTQLARVIALYESDAYCIDIMTQILAVVGLLRGAHERLMETHLRHCFRQAMTTASEAKKSKMVEEILQVTRLIR